MGGLLTALECSPAVSRSMSPSWACMLLMSPDPRSSTMSLATGEFQFRLAFGNTGKTSCDEEKKDSHFLKSGVDLFFLQYKDLLFLMGENLHEMISIPSLNPFKMILTEF